MMRSILAFSILVLAACGYPAPSDVAPLDGAASDAAVGPPSRLVRVAGDGQMAPPSSELPIPLEVAVTDDRDHPIAGVTVDFAVTGGGGTLAQDRVDTDANGRARSVLTLGPQPGANAVEVRVEGLPSVFFTANGVIGSATEIVLTSGDHQDGTMGRALAEPFIATVKDVAGNPVAGFPVTFVVTAGGGSVSTTEATSDSTGRVKTILTLGSTSVGPHIVQASATGLSGSPIVFTAFDTTSHIELVAGDGQRGAPGVPLAPFVVQVKDAQGNPIAGFPLSFAVTAGAGSVVPMAADTDASGLAQSVLMFGGDIANKVEARATGLVNSPIVFTAPLFKLAPKVDFATATKPFFVAIGDLNADGKPDLAIPNLSSDSISVLRNTTIAGAITPSFSARADFLTGVGSRPAFVALGDFNSDGKLDLAAANARDNSVSVLRNLTTDGATTLAFAATINFTTGRTPQSVAVSDINGDGRPDLVTANISFATGSPEGTISVLMNTTAPGATVPSFAANVDFAMGRTPKSVAVGDFNADGKPDIAVAFFSDTSTSVLLNRTAPGAATPSFAGKVDFPTGTAPGVVAVGDFDRDGKLDLVVSTTGSSTVSVLRNTTANGAAAPSFAPQVVVATLKAGSIAVGDLNGDGKPDLAVAHDTSAIAILLNNAATGATTPSFAAKLEFATGSGPEVAIGELNGDGRPDVAAANVSSNTVSILLAQ